MRFKSFFIVLTLLLGIFCLSGCDETEAEGALRRLKRAMNEVVSIGVELDLLNESDLNQSEMAIESAFIESSTGSLPKPVEYDQLKSQIFQVKASHIVIKDHIAHLSSIKTKVEHLINKIRNNEELTAQLDFELINQAINTIQKETEILKNTIGGVFKVYRLKVEPNLDNVVSKAEELKNTFEDIISSLSSRVLSLKRVYNCLIDIEYQFSILDNQE